VRTLKLEGYAHTHPRGELVADTLTHRLVEGHFAELGAEGRGLQLRGGRGLRREPQTLRLEEGFRSWSPRGALSRTT